MQKYDAKRAALGVLRSQRNVFQFLSRGGLLKQALAPEVSNVSPSTSTSSLKSSVSNSPATSSSSSSDTPSKIEGRPVRSCTLTTPKAKRVVPVDAAVSQKKTVTKKSPPAVANKRINPKHASFKYNSDSSSSLSSSSSICPPASESATVYQQQLVIKQLQKSMEESEKKRVAEMAEMEKKHSAQITALTSVADEYKKLLTVNNSSSSAVSTSINKRKSAANHPNLHKLI